MAKIDRSGRAPEVTRLNGLPFNLEQWIAREMQGDMGSVGNKEVFKHSDFIFMIVKGPNARNDYHIDPYDEIFYQLKGTVQVGLIGGDGNPTVAEIHEVEVLLVSANTPHSPRRPPETLGLVVERPRVPARRTASFGIVIGAGKSCTRCFCCARTSKPSSKQLWMRSMRTRICAPARPAAPSCPTRRSHRLGRKPHNGTRHGALKENGMAAWRNARKQSGTGEPGGDFFWKRRKNKRC